MSSALYGMGMGFLFHPSRTFFVAGVVLFIGGFILAVAAKVRAADEAETKC